MLKMEKMITMLILVLMVIMMMNGRVVRLCSESVQISINDISKIFVESFGYIYRVTGLICRY